MAKPTSTQLGAIAENLVANTLMLESGGRLVPFVPQADDDGIDLLIYDKETGRALPVQIKSRTITLKRRGSEERGDVVHFEVRRATFRAERYAAAILVLTAENGYRIDAAWVVPMEQLNANARQGSTKLVARPSRSAKSRDRWAEFRCDSPVQLYKQVLAMIDSTPAVRPLTGNV